MRKHHSKMSMTELFDETSMTENLQKDERVGVQKLCSHRWLTICSLSLGMVIIHAQRVNLSVSLLAVYGNLTNKVGSETAKEHLPSSTDWSALEISFLHSAFFLGYLLTQIPGGIASYKFRANRVFGAAVLGSCLLNLTLPALIQADIYWATMAVRVLQGLSEGFLWPASYTMVNHWTPRNERSKLAGLVASGSYAGAIIGFPSSGLIAHYFGWQYTYYSAGAAGVLWCIIWFVCIYEKPDHHPRISEAELLLLTKGKSLTLEPTSWKGVPWKKIAASPPFLALCACGFAKGWVFNLLLTQEPTYMHVFGYNIAQNGVLSALPFLMKIIICYMAGVLADVLVNHTFVDRTHVRKIFNTLGFGVEALCLFSLCFVYNGTTALVLLSAGVSIGGMAVSGWQINHLDLAPRLAGILVAVTQCFSNLAGIFSPLTAGYFIEESGTLATLIERNDVTVPDKDIYGWHMVFLLSSLIILICCVIYIIFASGEEQDWAVILPDQGNTSRDSSAVISYKALERTNTNTEISSSSSTLSCPDNSTDRGDNSVAGRLDR